MILKIDETGPPLSEEDIGRFESEIGLSLPIDYKTFLLKNNGGRPTPNAYPIEGLQKNPFGVIQVFFGLNDAVESCNLDWNWNTLDGRIPSNLLPIACDDGGDLICYSLFGPDAGSIVFWDLHQEPPEPSYSNVYRIADSFVQFLDSIQELPGGNA